MALLHFPPILRTVLLVTSARLRNLRAACSGGLHSFLQASFWNKIVLVSALSILTVVDFVKLLLKFPPISISVTTTGIDESKFADSSELRRTLTRLGAAGPRTTGSQTHNELIDWLEQELRGIPGLHITSDEYQIRRWRTVNEGSLKDAGQLTLGKDHIVPIAGVVPFSMVTTGQGGPMVYLPSSVPITAANSNGKVILRDFPSGAIPYSIIYLPSYSKTTDVNEDLLSTFDRPGHADGPLRDDLIAAGKIGAAGMIIMFDIEQDQVESYFEPHQGVHYKLPAMFVGIDEGILLKSQASMGAVATLSIKAEVSDASTRNLVATLPGQIKERVIFETHTDGNTMVQENGPVAVLALARYFANEPLSSRKRTIQFALNTGHLHISREGSERHAAQLDASYDDGTLALVIPIEHLGTREIEAVPRSGNKPGRRLQFSGRNELMLWCVGPTPPVIKAVQDAVSRRKLDRVVITRGTSLPNLFRVPTYASFGGIGTHYHNHLLPTTSLISGPWSLWAPCFGIAAVDINRLRSQALALGDIYFAIDTVPREIVESGYREHRKKRAAGNKTALIVLPPEIL